MPKKTVKPFLPVLTFSDLQLPGNHTQHSFQVGLMMIPLKCEIMARNDEKVDFALIP